MYKDVYSPKNIYLQCNITPQIFYSTNAQDMPQGFEGCTILSEESNNTICNTIASSNASMSSGEIYKCYQNGLCKNQSLVNKLYQLRNNHYMSQELYDNTKQKYNFEVIKTLNLIVGIAFAIMFIHYNKPSA